MNQRTKTRRHFCRKYGEPVGPCVRAVLDAMDIERSCYRYAASITDVKRILRAQGVSVRRDGTWTGKTVNALARALKSGGLDRRGRLRWRGIWLVWVQGHVILLGRRVKVDTDARLGADRRKIRGAWRLTKKS